MSKLEDELQQISQTDQTDEAIRSCARLTAMYYRELRREGIGSRKAIQLTAAWISTAFKPNQQG